MNHYFNLRRIPIINGDVKRNRFIYIDIIPVFVYVCFGSLKGDELDSTAMIWFRSRAE